MIYQIEVLVNMNIDMILLETKWFMVKNHYCSPWRAHRLYNFQFHAQDCTVTNSICTDAPNSWIFMVFRVCEIVQCTVFVQVKLDNVQSSCAIILKLDIQFANCVRLETVQSESLQIVEFSWKICNSYNYHDASSIIWFAGAITQCLL